MIIHVTSAHSYIWRASDLFDRSFWDGKGMRVEAGVRIWQKLDGLGKLTVGVSYETAGSGVLEEGVETLV